MKHSDLQHLKQYTRHDGTMLVLKMAPVSSSRSLEMFRKWPLCLVVERLATQSRKVFGVRVAVADTQKSRLELAVEVAVTG